MKLILSILLLALTPLVQAANLQLNFDQGSFSGSTSGTFTLTGVMPAHGFGSGGYYIGSTYINEHWSFSTQYDNPVGNSFANDFGFNLSGFSASGDTFRSGVTYPVFNIGITMEISNGDFSRLTSLTVYIQDQPNPLFDGDIFPNGEFTLNMTGSFVATSSVGTDLSPDSSGMALANLGGTYVNQYDSGIAANALTVSVTSVPEPSTASLIGLAIISFLFRRRHS